MRRIILFSLLCILTAAPLAAQDFTGTLAQIQKSGTFKIGYRQSYPPLSAQDKTGAPIGYSIDICNAIADTVKKSIGKDIKIEYIPVTANNRFEAISNNEIDILCGATTQTLARRELVDFTQLTFVTGASFMTLRGANIRNNFEGKKIGAVNKTTTVSALKELFAEAGTSIDIVQVNSVDDGLVALEKGSIDALSGDQIVLIGLAMTASDPNKFTLLPDIFSYEPFALAVRRNDADFRLLADRTISQLYRSGEIFKIYDKWLGSLSTSRSTAFEAMVELNSLSEK